MNRVPHIEIILVIVLATASCSATDQTTQSFNYSDLSPFAVSYEKVQPEQVAPYDVVIVEPNHYNKAEVMALKATDTKVLAYVSVGEVNPNRWYYSILEERGFLGMNPNWNSYYINLADSVTYNFFFEEIFPELAIRGFDGFFLDTVDAVAPYTPRKHLEPHMISLINQIHTEYPDHMLVQNAGFFLLDRTAGSLNAVLIEDVATHYDFQTDSYTLKESDKYQQKMNTIKQLSEENEIPFLILDFAKGDALRSQAIQRLDSLSYPYFINNIELNNISDGISGNNY